MSKPVEHSRRYLEEQLTANRAHIAKLESQAAAMREALEDIVRRDEQGLDADWPGLKSAGMRQVAQAALAPDAGRNFVPLERLERAERNAEALTDARQAAYQGALQRAEKAERLVDDLRTGTLAALEAARLRSAAEMRERAAKVAEAGLCRAAPCEHIACSAMKNIAAEIRALASAAQDGGEG